MRAAKFDSLRSFDRLRSSGMEDEQARIIVTLVEESAQNSLENLANKEDLKREVVLSEARLDNKITEVEARLDNRMTEVEVRLDNKINEVKSELKQDIALTNAKIDALKNELKQEIALSEGRLDAKISRLEATLGLMVKLFFGSIILILVNVVGTFLHY